MLSPELEKLVEIGSLKRGALSDSEARGLLRGGRARLTDALNPELSLESRFDLTYNAAHSLALLALRRLGYRSENRYTVFQCLAHTTNVPTPHWRVLSAAHSARNFFEYEGESEIDERLVSNMIDATEVLYAELLERSS